VDKKSMVADLAALVTAESPSSDLGAVDACADVVAEIGERHLGSTPERIRIDGRQHLRWSFGAEPKVMLLGHFDTVWPLGTLAELPWSVTDNIATGPGVFDMKAGIVQLFHALASLPSLDGVVVLLNSDEEIGSPTSRALIEEQARQVDAVLVLEAAADGAVKTARKGMSLYCVDIEGRAAHAGLEPERGVNAVVELAHQIQAVVELADPAAGTSVVPSVISGGTTTNTVAAQAQLWCDVRMWSATEQERIDRSIRALTPALAESRISVSGGPNRGPLESVSSEKLYFLAHQVSSESGLGMLRDCAVGEQARERVRQDAGPTGWCVIADKQSDVVIGRQSLRHALHLRCSEDQTRPWIQVGVKQIVHRSVAVVDQDARRTGVERTGDRGIGLGGHEHLRTVVAATAADRLIERRDTRDTLHVHRNIDVHSCPPSISIG